MYDVSREYRAAQAGPQQEHADGEFESMDEDEDSPDGDDDDDDADEEEDEDEDDDDHDDDDDDSDNGDESEPLVSHVGTLSTIDSATATPQQIQDQLQNVMSIMQQAHAQMISRATVSVPTWSSASKSALIFLV